MLWPVSYFYQTKFQIWPGLVPVWQFHVLFITKNTQKFAFSDPPSSPTSADVIYEWSPSWHKTRPNLKFCLIEITHRTTYIQWLWIQVPLNLRDTASDYYMLARTRLKDLKGLYKAHIFWEGQKNWKNFNFVLMLLMSPVSHPAIC